jgi:hypothetical protein
LHLFRFLDLLTRDKANPALKVAEIKGILEFVYFWASVGQ